MFLILEVVSPNASVLGSAARAVFTSAGGSIGRRPGNDWVLPDGHVSGRHARVRAIGGTFFLEDNESANGVSVNGTKLHPGEPFPLKDGDAVFIDPFEMSVRVSMTKPGGATEVLRGQLPGQAVPPPVATPGIPASVAPSHELPAAGAQPSGLGDLVPEAGGMLPSDFNPLLDERPAPPSPPTAAGLQARSVIHDAFDIPVAAPIPTPAGMPPIGGGGIPSNWDLDEFEATLSPLPPVQPATPAAAPGPAAPLVGFPPPALSREPVIARATPMPVSAQAIGADFSSLLRGAGVHGEALSPEVMAEFGQVLRAVIEGLMEVLRARVEIRNEFRLPQTTFKTRDNNPLKLAVNAEDAIHNLLVKRNPAYLGTAAAFEDALKDVRYHQLAMLAGMRAAFQFMLQRLDPQALKSQFDARPGRRGLSFGAQGRYWESYEEFYRETTADADDCFRRLFGDQFARAYEEQMQSLRATRPQRP